MKGIGFAVVAGLLFLMGGCSSYYQVLDPVTGKIYYTMDYDSVMGGAVEFRDARTGAEVALQNSEVKEMNEEEFDVARFATKPEVKAEEVVCAVPGPVQAPGAVQP